MRPNGHRDRLAWRHPSRAWIVTVEGDAAPMELPAGSYVFQPEDQLHNDRCKGPEDCMLFVHQHGMADMLLPHTEH